MHETECGLLGSESQNLPKKKGLLGLAGPRSLIRSWQPPFKESRKLPIREKPRFQSQLLSCMVFSIFTLQNGSIVTNQDVRFYPISAFGPIKLQIWTPHLHKNGPIKGQRGHYFYISCYQFGLFPGGHFWFPAKSAFSRGAFLFPVCKSSSE